MILSAVYERSREPTPTNRDMREDDDTLSWNRRIRHEISEEHGHDPRRLVEYYMELQKTHEERLIETAAPEDKRERETA